MTDKNNFVVFVSQVQKWLKPNLSYYDIALLQQNPDYIFFHLFLSEFFESDEKYPKIRVSRNYQFVTNNSFIPFCIL